MILITVSCVQLALFAGRRASHRTFLLLQNLYLLYQKDNDDMLISGCVQLFAGRHASDTTFLPLENLYWEYLTGGL
jgi:hypothetical protein